MNAVILKVDGSLPGGLTFELQRPTGGTLCFEGKSQSTVEEIKNDPSLLSQLLPANLSREIGQWDFGDPTPGLLAVSSTIKAADGVPWEYLPQLFQWPTAFVVRYLDKPELAPDKPAESVRRLLAAGWSGQPTFQLPGIQEELAALSQLATADVQVKVWFEPSLEQLGHAFHDFRPDLLHLIPATILHNKEMPEMVLSGGEEITRVRTDEFLSRLSDEIRPRLVVLNTCGGGESGGGPSAIRLIAEYLRTVAIGWLGVIGDRDAVDFARFIYSRLLDGKTIVDTLRSYRSIELYKGYSAKATRGLGPAGYRRADNPIPVVWTASIPLLDMSLRGLPHAEPVPPGEPEARTFRGGGATMRGPESWREEVRPPVSGEPALPSLDVKFEPQKWLNPALLKNGQPAINRLVLDPNQALSNVEVMVSCDTGHGISTVRQTTSLEKGPQPLPIEGWQFPVLYELIGADVPRRQVNFTVSCSAAGQLLAENTTSVLWMGRTEWLDQEDTWRYIPAFVDPYSEGVLDVVGKADVVLKTIASPTSSFSGYQAADSEFVKKQVEAVFQCLRDKPFELGYIAPPPIAVYKPGDQLASGQRIRTPDEVVGRKRGTCHDLAILFASCLEHIQIYPLIILIPGHTFFGFWKDAQAHEDFWRQAHDNKLRRPQDPGRDWTITDREEIRQLVERDVISLVEATKVTDRTAVYAAAVQAGYDRLFNESLNPFLRLDVAVDIHASRYAIQPL